ncbi:hypothetical protein KIH41_07025 [Litoribacter ruber]|uniref:Uncharacterized protein n=1 Tax=Litoribacter ruber TaxID=702568 RepID=A0AAP2CDY8_9BACT|nr:MULTISPECIES: hypothetical protein [Litoribacter]MBS9522511.1 hypothetical protein [Litoribacter alkaliphilus]MBT0811031.1 hypothetical protein [Litoribacter ruber]
MKIFHNNHFENLAKTSGECVVSIYIPTSQKSTDSYQADKTHFKNQLAATENDLKNICKMEEEDIEKFLKPGYELLEDYDFWKYNSDMLAYYIIDGKAEFYRLPINLDKGMHFVGKRPFLLPLIPELTGDGRFYVLLLNLDRIRLFEATRNTMNEIELDPEEVAVSFTAEEEEDENQESLQGQGGVGKAGAMFHGHAKGSDEEKKVTILNYFHRMTNMLEPILNQHPLPLYLAGVDYLIPLFRQASKYHHLMEGHVSGAQFNVKNADHRELHQKAWAIAEPHFEKEKKDRKEDFGFKASKNLAVSNDYAKLIKASITGGVDTLLVSQKHKHLWGTYDENNYKLSFDDDPDGNNHCLIDLAAVKVKENGGKVYLVDPEHMPDSALIAGTLRYEL